MVMKKLKKLIQRVNKDPLHLILGLDLVMTGLILLTHRHYFFWPPWPEWVIAVENNIVVGLIGIVSGVGMIYWAISAEKSIRLNRRLIPTASAYFTLLAATEFLHGFFAPLGTPHMYTTGVSELIMTLITLYMARDSPTHYDE